LTYPWGYKYSVAESVTYEGKNSWYKRIFLQKTRNRKGTVKICATEQHVASAENPRGVVAVTTSKLRSRVFPSLNVAKVMPMTQLNQVSSPNYLARNRKRITVSAETFFWQFTDFCS
jgi:hypothetical protein